MRTLYVAAELYPLVKTGGLGDVTSALPPALRALDVDVRLLLPGYPALQHGIADLRPVGELGPAFGAPSVVVLEGRSGDVPVYLIDAPAFYDRPGNPYLGPDGRDWPDNHLRFALLGWAAAQAAIVGFGDWRPQVVHGHDWHAGLAPAYLAAAGRPAASVFTIHNLAFQGVFPSETFGSLGLPLGFFHVDGVEFYGQVSFMKAALWFADRITTVSPTYAREIREPAYGTGLDGLLRGRARDVSGILNGVDYAIWNPSTDPNLPAPFDEENLGGKGTAKAALQRELGLEERPDAPVFGAVTRLTHQKGFDLVAHVLPDIVAAGAQLALLGSGDDALERTFRSLAEQWPGRVGVRIGYDEGLAHRIIGGSDAILVPSRFEPCGLTQLYALRYGTLPIVRRTGGLADTVTDASDPDATGFVFDADAAEALGDAMRRALALYGREGWARVRRNAMHCRFGWDRSASAYRSLYRAAAGLSQSISLSD